LEFFTRLIAKCGQPFFVGEGGRTVLSEFNEDCPVNLPHEEKAARFSPRRTQVYEDVMIRAQRRPGRAGSPAGDE
jgi:hypothetical protein